MDVVGELLVAPQRMPSTVLVRTSWPGRRWPDRARSATPSSPICGAAADDVLLAAGARRRATDQLVTQADQVDELGPQAPGGRKPSRATAVNRGRGWGRIAVTLASRAGYELEV